MRDRWSSSDYEILFANHPPTHARAPTMVEARRIADRLRRSTGAVRTQWDDARSLVLGNPTAASVELRSFIAERWLGIGARPSVASAESAAQAVPTAAGRGD